MEPSGLLQVCKVIGIFLLLVLVPPTFSHNLASYEFSTTEISNIYILQKIIHGPSSVKY